MATISVFGLTPVYVYTAPDVLTLLYVPSDTKFFNMVPTTTPAPSAPPVEPVEEKLSKEEEEAGDAFFAKMAEKQLDEAAREWEAEEEDRVEEELQHVAELLSPEHNKKEELQKLFRELNRLNREQHPLYKECENMRKELKATGIKNPGYWEMWNRMVATQKEWLSTLEALKALDAELRTMDPEYNFNTLANKTWYPDEPERDYWALYAMISRSFNSNIARDKEMRANAYKASADKTAPASATLDQLVMAHVCGVSPA